MKALNAFSILFIILICSSSVQAQIRVGSTPEAQELFAKARAYVAKKDLTNAILVYNQLVRLEPKNIFFRREMANTYYLAGDKLRATQVIMPLLKAEQSDDIVYYYAGKILMERGMTGDAMKALDQGIKKYPKSGVLYELKGRLWNQKQKYDKAVETWEEGVKNDPSYHFNYYNLAKSYYVSKRPIWAILYSEAFINLNKRSRQSDEMKRVLFDSYKQLMGKVQMAGLQSDKKMRNERKAMGGFEQDIYNKYSKIAYLTRGGIDVNNITMLRTRFLLDWAYDFEHKPYELFSYLNGLLKNGQFEMYNRWLFGGIDDQKKYELWLKDHPEQLNSFETNFYHGFEFKPIVGQYYK